MSDCLTCCGVRECSFFEFKPEPMDRRQQFIREAAIRFASIVDAGPINHDSCGHSCLLAKADEAWTLAKALWEAKPEDC